MKEPSPPPRCSEFYIYSNCPASYELMRKSGEEPAASYAFKGTKIHRVLAGFGGMEQLNAEEEKIFEELWDAFRETLKEWRAGAKVDSVWNEQEFVYDQSLFIGHPDKIVQSGSRLFIVDFKTGYYPKDAISATNCQLRGYVALADHSIKGISEITVWVDKPGQRDSPFHYGVGSILAAKRWALEVVERVTAPGPKKPVKGDWCQYCSGKVICPAWKHEIINFSEIADAVEIMPDAALALLAPKLAIAAKVIERLRARLEARVRENPRAFPGWRFEPGRLRAKIVDVASAWDTIKEEVGAEGEKDLLAALKLNISDLEKIYKKYKGLTWENAKTDLRKKLGSNLIYNEDKPSLVYELPKSAIEDGEQHGNKSSITPRPLPGKTLPRRPEEDPSADH